MFKNGLNSVRILILIILAFLTRCVFGLAQEIPSTKDVLGFDVGSDHHLASYKQAYEYFQALERASPMIKLFELGKTSMGKPMLGAVITSAENMKKLERYKEISKTLALGKGLTDAEARRLASEGRVIVYIDGGLHGTEVAPAQHNLQLAYDLLTSKDADTQLIINNTILILVFANPDGMDMVAEWYHPNVGTPYETSPLPHLYHIYAGHDNNRDSFMLNLKETQNIHRLTNREWYPLVLCSHHQRGPFPARIFIPPNVEPINPNYHPLLVRWKNLIGSAIGAAFDWKGMAGAISRIRYDLWSPDMVDTVGDLFHTVSICPETQLYFYATPHYYTLNDLPEEYRGFTPSVFYPNPWKGGWWRLQNAVDYVLTCSKAVLHTAALYREKLLYGRYQMGMDVSARFQKEAPYAWVIPKLQWDAPTASLMLQKMQMMGIEIGIAKADFACGGISYPEGTWVIAMQQPFALYVKSIFEEQRYPDLAKLPALWQGTVRPQPFANAYLPPYDTAGWTLPYQMGVKVVPANEPLEVALASLEEVLPPAGSVEGDAGFAYLLSPKSNNCFIAVNRILREGGKVLRARVAFDVAGKSYPPGTWIVRAGSVSKGLLDSLAKELFLNIESVGATFKVETYDIKVPRIALYKSWVATADEGWTRWLFEQFEFLFTNIHDADIKGGELNKRFDVLVIPSMSTDDIVNGHKPGTMPPEYVGGITGEGVRNIREFIERGGSLVLLNSGCQFAMDDLGMPLGDALKGLRPPGRGADPQAEAPRFACPGSILRMEFDPSHPVAYGMPREAAAVFSGSQAFTMLPYRDGQAKVIAKYPQGDLLLSGFLRGGNYLNNKLAAVEIPLQKGRVILLGFGVQTKAQPHGTFKLLFNSLYYGSAQESESADKDTVGF